MLDNEFLHRAENDTPEEPADVTKKKQPAPKGKKTRALTQILNGEFLTKEFVLNNLNFIFFIIFLLLLLVGKGYYGKQLTKDVDRTQKELDEVTAEYIEVKASLEENTRRQVLKDKLAERGLKETVNPTKVIRLKKNDGK